MITFLRFARAHTLIGTTLSVLTLYALATRITGHTDFQTLALTLFSCLCANVYITGLNQLYDVNIDKINKPYLPLASGDYSMKTGRRIVITCLILSIISASGSTNYLFATVCLSLIIGIAYSVPPIRLKRFPFWAAFCILAVRGLIVNVLLYLHFQSAVGGGHQLPTVIWLLTAVIFSFSIIIAWFKDLPDTKGDAAYNINTLSLQIGKLSVWRIGAGLLSLAFLFSAATAIFLLNNFGLAIGQLLLLLGLILLSKQLNLQQQASIARYYQGIWVLFFLEYALFAVFG